MHGEPHSFEFRVRPGPVRIVGVSLAWTDRQHGTVLNSNGFGRSRVLAEVRPDRGTEMELTMRMGGVLEVELQGALRAADTAALEDKIAALEARGKYVDREYLEREFRAALFLEDHLGRRAEPVTRIALSNLHSSAAGRHVMNEWPLGETHISEVLTPGTYTLRATFEGRPSVTKQVTIVAGQRSRVTLDLGR